MVTSPAFASTKLPPIRAHTSDICGITQVRRWPRQPSRGSLLRDGSRLIFRLPLQLRRTRPTWLRTMLPSGTTQGTTTISRQPEWTTRRCMLWQTASMDRTAFTSMARIPFLLPPIFRPTIGWMWFSRAVLLGAVQPRP